jgi:HSP20 family protein
MANQEIVNNADSGQLQTSEQVEPYLVTPPVDIYENDKEYLLVADMPGVSSDAVNVEFEANELRIRGTVHGASGTPYVYRRAFRVGAGIDPNKISAKLERGVLRVTAKKSDALKPRQIKVKAA